MAELDYLLPKIGGNVKARLAIRTDGKKGETPIVFAAPFAPKQVTYSGYENTYEEISRPDRKPIVRRSGEGLRRMSMELFIGSFSMQTEHDEELSKLEQLAASRLPLVIEYDPRTWGYWHITSLSYDSVERRETDDVITRATVQIEFVEIPDKTAFTLNIKNKYKYTSRPKTYTAKKGESLREVVKKFYGTANKNIIKAVAKANNIKNPKHVKPGQKIKLP